MPESRASKHRRLFPLVMAVIVGLLGLWMAGLGAYLAALGGSLYYVLAGIGLLATAVGGARDILGRRR